MTIVYDDTEALKNLDLIHPDSDQKVGEMPMSQAYLVLHSLGRRAQRIADAAEAARAAAAEAIPVAPAD